VGQAEKAALLIEKGEVHPPGVDSQGGDILSIFLYCQLEPVEDFAVEAEDVPDQTTG